MTTILKAKSMNIQIKDLDFIYIQFGVAQGLFKDKTQIILTKYTLSI